MSTLPCDRFIRVFHAVESDSRRHVLASAPEFARLFHQTKHRLQGRYEIDRFPSRGRGLSPETRRQGRRPRRGRLATFASGSRCLRRYACPLAGMPVPQETPFASDARDPLARGMPGRTEERRVGKGGGSAWRFGGVADTEKKK